MPRLFVVGRDADFQTVTGKLLTSRASTGPQADSALAALQALNPHVDLKKLRAGTVLLVPDSPSFKASATDPVAGEALDGFAQLVKNGFAAAAADLKTGNETRNAQRNDVAAAIKSAAVKRLIDADPDLRQQVDEALKAAKDDQVQAAQAEQQVDAATKGALTELASLAKLLG
jgi:hypothetical protein